MSPRLYAGPNLGQDTEFDLPPGAARHAQVLRLQPGHALTLFDGSGLEWSAQILHMGRSHVRVRLGASQALEREAARAVHVAVGLMAAERMDWLVEKATELGAASLQPLLCERSSLRPVGERAQKKHAHWQAVAVAACEQSGRNRLMQVHAPGLASAFLAPAAVAGEPPEARWVLSLAPQAQPIGQALQALQPGQAVRLLSGPEGGLTPDELSAAQAAGYQAVGLGPRVLRAETAPLAALAALVLV